MSNYLSIISTVVFILVACGSMIMNVYLMKYTKDKWISTILRAILFFNSFFFLVSIPTLYGTPEDYLVVTIPIILVISLFISYGNFLFMKLFKKMLIDKQEADKDK